MSHHRALDASAAGASATNTPATIAATIKILTSFSLGGRSRHYGSFTMRLVSPYPRLRSPRSIAPLVGATIATIALLIVVAPASSAPRCGKRLATELEKRLPVTPYDAVRRLRQVKCYDITGDGREDIVFSGWEFMNHGAHYWAAFRATRTEWKRMKFKRSCCRADPRVGVGISLERSGHAVTVSQPVYRSSDPACCPTGGTRSGTWRWRHEMLALTDTTRSP